MVGYNAFKLRVTIIILTSERAHSPLSVLLHNTLISLHLSMYQRWIFLICKYVNYDLTTAIVRRVTFSRPVRVKTTLVCIQF